MTADEKSVIFQEKFRFHKKKDFIGRRENEDDRSEDIGRRKNKDDRSKNTGRRQTAGKVKGRAVQMKGGQKCEKN